MKRKLFKLLFGNYFQISFRRIDKKHRNLIVPLPICLYNEIFLEQWFNYCMDYIYKHPSYNRVNGHPFFFRVYKTKKNMHRTTPSYNFVLEVEPWLKICHVCWTLKQITVIRCNLSRQPSVLTNSILECKTSIKSNPLSRTRMSRLHRPPGCDLRLKTWNLTLSSAGV